MKKIMLIMLFILTGFTAKEESRVVSNISYVRQVIEIKPTIKLKEVKIEYKRTLHPKEWFAFHDWSWQDHKYEPIPYTQRQLDVMTDMLTIESNYGDSKPHQIDQYFVVLGGVRAIGWRSDVNSLQDLIAKSGLWSEKPTYHRGTWYWKKNQEIVKNVLNCTLPAWVPYMPTSASYYWNSRLDTNMKQKERLETTCVCFASSIRDHHYFAKWEFLTQEEQAWLLLNPNPIKKNISNGIIYDQRIS